MALMAYFRDQHGRELPYSGSLWCWTNGYVSGEPDTCSQIEVRIGRRYFMLTADSFPGHSVTVKVWAPRGSTYRRLVHGPVQSVDRAVTWVGREAPALAATVEG